MRERESSSCDTLPVRPSWRETASAVPLRRKFEIQKERLAGRCGRFEYIEWQQHRSCIYKIDLDNKLDLDLSLVISRHHDHSNAGSTTDLQGLLAFWSGWVVHSHNS